MKNKNRYTPWVILVLITLFAGSCKDDNNEAAFDPTKPVVISKFSPETGSANTRLLIEGENFGANPENIEVNIGGARATMVGVNGTSLYCVVPKKAAEGTIEVIVYDDNGIEKARTTATDKFDYKSKRLVSTLAGEIDEKNKLEVKDGPFGDCGGFYKLGWLSFDPKNPDHLYSVGEEAALRLIDLKKKYVTTLISNGINGMYRMRSISWSHTADTMVIATYRSSEGSQSNAILKRETGFVAPNAITTTKKCTGSAIHPVNGELYFGEESAGNLYTYDFHSKAVKILHKVQGNDTDFKIQIHPSGNYAYLIVHSRHLIMRTDYNWEDKVFTTPYIVCGENNSASWVDGVGKKVRLNKPYQGTWVKNPEYAGKADEYDFYFCDRSNHCIRILTPDGKVTTFAGRGSPGAENKFDGYVDGDLREEARFNHPEGIIYDEVNNIFYIGDSDNHRIRTIAYED